MLALVVSALCDAVPVPPSVLFFHHFGGTFIWDFALRIVLALRPSMLVLGAFFHGMGPVGLDGCCIRCANDPLSLLTPMHGCGRMNWVKVPLPP